MERDLFGSILFMSLQHQIDVGELFKIPLTPVPLSLCHVDGSMLKTQKSKRMGELEQRNVATDPGHVDVTIVDGMFFFHLLKDPPMLLGDISMFILRKVCRIDSDEIHLVFDCIVKP